MNLQSLLPILLIAVLIIPMMLMGRKQKKAMAQQQELQNSLGVGDRVMTTSGLYATVSDVSDDASIGLEIAPGVETTWLRAAVREKVGPEVTEDEDTTDGDEAVDSTEDTAKVQDTVPVGEPKSTAEIAPPLEHDKSSR